MLINLINYKIINIQEIIKIEQTISSNILPWQGIEINDDESFENIQGMIKAIEKVAAEYNFYKNKVLEYNDDITRVIDEYKSVINNV